MTGPRHADVPDVLRLMASTDPAVRVPALARFQNLLDDDPALDEDELYIFDWVVPCLPFLVRIAARPGAPDRLPLLRILASAVGVMAEDFWPRWFSFNATLWSARAAVAAEVPTMVTLFDDGDPEVRGWLARVLVGAAQDSDAAIAALRHRYDVEPDPAVRAALPLRVAWAATNRGEGTGRDEALAWLEQRLAGCDDPLAVLDVVHAMLTADADAMPGRVVPLVLRQLDRVDRILSGETAPPAPPATLTMVSHDEYGIHRRRDSVPVDELRRGPDVPWWYPAPLYGIQRALAHRLPERVDLLRGCFRSPRWYVRQTAYRLAADQIEGWRGDHRDLLLDLHTGRDPDERVGKLQHIGHFGAAVAPVVDLLLADLDDPARATVRIEGGLDLVAPDLQAVADTGDPRVLPLVRRLLASDDLPDNLKPLLDALGPRAGDLVDLIHGRMVELAGRPGGADDPRVLDLADVLAGLGDRAAPLADDVVALLATGTPSARVVDAAGRLGPAAASAAPILRRHLDSLPPDDAVGRMTAATALWRVGGAAGPALALVEHGLDGSPQVQVGAAELAAALGPVAAPFLPRLAGIAAAETSGGQLHLAVGAAAWRITGQARPAVGLLCAAVDLNPRMLLVPAADRLAEIGPAAGEAEPLLRRYLPTGAVEQRPERGAREDHQRIDACARALARIAGGSPPERDDPREDA